MTEKDIKKLGRAELLELLISQAEENERLRSRLASVEKQLSDRSIIMDECGSIAEASLRLGGVFEAAQKAADEYLENIKLYTESREDVFKRHEAEAFSMSKRLIAEAEKKCQYLEEETKKKCDEMVRIAKREAENYWNSVSAKREEQLKQQTEIFGNEVCDE